jgi:hypothetical protein
MMHAFKFDAGGFIVTLYMPGETREEAETKVEKLLLSSSFPTWLDNMLPVNESMHQ